MKYYEVSGNRVTCLLCQHYCKLKEDQVGICGVNKNIANAIENLVYGYPAAINIDPVEKKPLYHVLPGSRSLSLGTAGCNFHCPFCQNWGISQEKHIKKDHYYAPLHIAKLAKEHACQSIAYTYNEPTIFYPYAKDIALEAKKLGIKNLFVSNGFESTEVIDDMRGIIDAANIDLKSFDANYYKKELGGDLEKILQNLKQFKKNGIWIEVTTLIIPTKNDSNKELESIATFIANELGAETPWHISAFHPDYKEQDLPSTSLKTLKRAHNIGKRVGLKYMYIGNVGYENPTLCSRCGELLIERGDFNITKNSLIDGACPNCSHALDGIF
ncbi:MAG: AmmeMemoRadiSam system radical SAM enzyme [Campylobacterota bacterium]|nr:AmmeMemoRadiSam system radical SAM enzyme [Campylobacterota bacterium]